METNLEKAKRLYSIGTIIDSLNNNGREFRIVDSIIEDSDGNLRAKTREVCDNSPNQCFIFYKNEWANIIKTRESTSNNLIQIYN